MFLKHFLFYIVLDIYMCHNYIQFHFTKSYESTSAMFFSKKKIWLAVSRFPHIFTTDMLPWLRVNVVM